MDQTNRAFNRSGASRPVGFATLRFGIKSVGAASEFGQRHHQVVIFGEDPNRDMVGACKQVFVHVPRSRLECRKRTYGVNQVVARRRLLLSQKPSRFQLLR